jgi:hypothetical protein
MAETRKAQAGSDRRDSIFAKLLDTVQHCSLGQITQALYEVGGAYRRNLLQQGCPAGARPGAPFTWSHT